MQRITISLEDGLAKQFSAWMKAHRYHNRSEAFRDLLRQRLGEEALNQAPTSPCLASVVYVFDHHERELGRRLTRSQHRHHQLSVSTLHVHLNAEQCLEIAVLRGPCTSVMAEAQALVAERGVRHGKVHVIPMDAEKSHPHK